MSIRHTLATRIRDLMASRVTLDTQTKLSGKAGVSQSTIQRILSEEASATIDSVAAIAGAFGVAPVDMLRDESEDARLLSLWGQLNGSDKKRVLSFIEVSIEADRSSASRLEFSQSRNLQPAQIAKLQRASSAPLSTEPLPDAGKRDARRNGGSGGAAN